jgi:hypothetical protein
LHLDSLREFVGTVDLSEAECLEWQALLAQAERGDVEALLAVQLIAMARGYEPPPGVDWPVKPGKRMVCPVDPTHYATYQHDVGKVLTCPEHKGVVLVPAGEG